MPISFIEQVNSEMDPKLKARYLMREFASLRYGIFKESGFRLDQVYPPFSSLPGLTKSTTTAHRSSHNNNNNNNNIIINNSKQLNSWSSPSIHFDTTNSLISNNQSNKAKFKLRGFDQYWNECSFDTQAATGMPAGHASSCAPFLVKPAVVESSSNGANSNSNSNSNKGWSNQIDQLTNELNSFNLMSADLFSHSNNVLKFKTKQKQNGEVESYLPLEWRDLAANLENNLQQHHYAQSSNGTNANSINGLKWHFCGEQFQLAPQTGTTTTTFGRQASGPSITRVGGPSYHPHNQLALNKQNIMCNERSAMEIIRANDDFRHAPLSPSTFNRLPETGLKFIQEMPQRIVLCVEYAAHLYQAHRLDNGILEAAIGKWLAYDLIADTEFALVLFGQQHSHKYPFKRLDSSVDSRLTLFSPPIDPFEEGPKFYSEQELASMDINNINSNSNGNNQNIKFIKGTCSFSKLLSDAISLIQQASRYDDQGADLILLTTGLFIEDGNKIEELIRSNNIIRNDLVQINIIIYPSSMLFDTKSYLSSYITLDSSQSESLIKNRIEKLLLIQRLTGAKIHLIKEHLDSNGDVKMSTLLQFYQIFQHISSGHSWDQTDQMVLLNQEQIVETSRITKYINNMNENNNSLSSTSSSSSSSLSSNNLNQQQLHKLEFQFQLDNSLENELIVGFIDPKQTRSKRMGKRFTLRNLQLRSPSGQLVLTDPTTTTTTTTTGSNSEHAQDSSNIQHDQLQQQQHSPSSSSSSSASNSDQLINEQIIADQEETFRSSNAITEAALFPYRAQLGIAGFHLGPAHLLSVFNNTRRSVGSSGLWTLSAISDELVQTSAVAMARVNPKGDSITASCWIQTYKQSQGFFGQITTSEQLDESMSIDDSSGRQQTTQAIKVFARIKSAPNSGAYQEVSSRLEIEDESGNIVQNVNMLDDGLGAPDMTKADGIHSQFVRRIHKPGFYRVMVEVTGPNQQRRSMRHRSSNSLDSNSIKLDKDKDNGQDQPCCGSSIPLIESNQSDTRFVSRQVYCGTFYLEPGNKLLQQRPPRVNDLSVSGIDQDTRRVTIRWNEPQIDIMSYSLAQQTRSTIYHSLFDGLPGNNNNNNNNELSGDIMSSAQAINHHQIDDHFSESSSSSNDERDSASSIQHHQLNNERKRGNIQVSKDFVHQTQGSRYEIKLFTDREAAKRAFDSKQDVGYRFTEWNVEGPYPNASLYGGTKEVTLRVPHTREGIYYVAMKVYNNLGIDSQMSNIIQFWIRANTTSHLNETLDHIYGQPVRVDEDGNVYDMNGELIQRSQQWPYGYQLMGPIDGLSMLVIMSIVAFLFSLVCISLVACLAGSTRRHSKRKSTSSDKPAMILASNGSSLASSQCASSQQSELNSSASVQSDNSGHDNDIKLVLSQDEPNMRSIQKFIQNDSIIAQNWNPQDQHHHQLIMSGEQLYNQHQQQQQQQKQLNHTIINGYAYATINSGQQQQQHQHQQQQVQIYDQSSSHFNNVIPNQVQSWTADVLMSHYDKVKEARERNEAPPVMRVETLDQSEGLPSVEEHQQNIINMTNHSKDHSYLLRRPSSRSSALANQLNQQLQQQLNTVLKGKRMSLEYARPPSINPYSSYDPHHTSPALEGLTDQISELGAPIERLVIPPPPPNYVYGNNSSSLQAPNQFSTNHLQLEQQAMLTEPSIYSQLTNLKQMNAPVMMMHHDQGQYYANQWQCNNTNGDCYQSTSPTNTNTKTNTNTNQPQGSYNQLDNSNSAISDV